MNNAAKDLVFFVNQTSGSLTRFVSQRFDRKFQIFWDGGSIKFNYNNYYNRCFLLNMFSAAHCPVIFENPSRCLFGGSGKKSCKIRCCVGNLKRRLLDFFLFTRNYSSNNYGVQSKMLDF